MPLLTAKGLQEPPAGAVLDPSHPLAHDLVAYVTFNGLLNGHDHVRDEPLVSSGTPIREGSTHGPTRGHTTATTRLTVGTNAGVLPNPSEVTILAGYRRRGGEHGGVPVAFSNDADNSGERCLLHGPYTNGFAYWNWGDYNGGPGEVAVGGLVYTRDTLFACTAGPRALELWQDGRLRGSVVGGNTRGTTSPTVPFNIGGGAATGFDSQNAAYWLFAVWSRQLSRSEIVELSERPFDLLTAPPRFWLGGISQDGGTTLTADVAGTLTTAGSFVHQGNRGLSGTLTTAGAVIEQGRRSVAGALTTSGAFVHQGRRAVAGTLTASGTVAALRALLASVGGTLTTAGAIARQGRKALSGTLATAGAVAKQGRRSLAGTLTTAGGTAALKAVLVSVGGTLSAAGTLARQGRRALTGTLTTAGSLSEQGRRAVSGTLTTAGSFVHQGRRSVSGTLSASGGLASLKAVLVYPGGALSAAGALIRQTRKTLSGTLPLAGTAARRNNRAVAGSLATSGAVAPLKVKFSTMSGTVSFSGTVATEVTEQPAVPGEGFPELEAGARPSPPEFGLR
jgi:hypothetical protein